MLLVSCENDADGRVVFENHPNRIGTGRWVECADCGLVLVNTHGLSTRPVLVEVPLW